jgi:guanylate kinase
MSSETRHAVDQPCKPLLIVLSGLSGAGKDSVLSRLKESAFPLEMIVTVTTRARRHNEKDGVHYTFVTPERFQAMVKSRELLEWATVYGNYYGVPREPVRRALESGRDVIVKVDVQGAATIRKIVPQALFIFLAVPTLEECAPRLRERRTESAADLALRLKTGGEEMAMLPIFDYIVFNRQGELDRAVADIEAIIKAEQCRVRPRDITV